MPISSPLIGTSLIATPLIKRATLAMCLQFAVAIPVFAEVPDVAQQMEENTTAIVLDFENGTANKLAKSVRKELALKFADKLDQQNAFETVLTERQTKKIETVKDDASVVVIGVVTKYRKKSANVRILVGVEEGISFFDTRIRLSQKKNVDGLRHGKVEAITVAEDTLLDAARDKGESVREYVEDAAQIIARSSRKESRAESKAKRKRIS